MARLSIVLALAGVLLVLATTVYGRTTITTVEIDNEAENPYSRQTCREQVQRQDLSRCEQFISRRTYHRGTTVLAMKGVEEEEEENSYPYSQQEVQQCCRQLRGLDQQCQCEGIQFVLQSQRQKGRFGQEHLQQAVLRARSLESLCRVPQRCDIRAALLA